ncbi:rhamnosyltransferase WbbL [Agarivorans sp. Toyoura001]|uniref:glycosyltransferase family 2 protein n=1 Tax=Agarivorans sp. Toyoura001 TaxID=2283141 RepID=UPI0010D20637|nr:glycosyltransferase family 2 protein [Agarivorans sp. Toyoura001]GDY24135.1 rhamnosyltransferase WbbL [Agarivorans sp. Toyoura001]
MSVFISVVSHGHGKLIQELGCLLELAKHFHVVVKINKKEPELLPYFEGHGIHYIDSDYGLGFGHNNNMVYRYCQHQLGMKPDDIFCVFNPDVVSTSAVFKQLLERMKLDNCQLAGVNLYKDEDFTIPDNSIRHFPSLFELVKSFLGLGNNTQIDKSKVLTPISVDWAAGSFLAFKSSLYQQLKGFDQGYFMYCEDIDICFRSKQMGVPLTFYPDIRMLHLAKHANRKIFSKHFYWHVSSVVRFLMSKIGLVTPKTLL